MALLAQWELSVAQVAVALAESGAAGIDGRMMEGEVPLEVRPAARLLRS